MTGATPETEREGKQLNNYCYQFVSYQHIYVYSSHHRDGCGTVRRIDWKTNQSQQQQQRRQI